MELCGCEDDEEIKEKYTECTNEWRYLCRSQRNCDFGSGDGEYDNQRQSGLAWNCLCWCLSCWCLFPRALWMTFVSCLYAMRSFCLTCLVILLCGVCYYCSNVSCSCTQCQSASDSEAQPDHDHDKSTTVIVTRQPTKAEDIV